MKSLARFVAKASPPSIMRRFGDEADIGFGGSRDLI